VGSVVVVVVVVVVDVVVDVVLDVLVDVLVVVLVVEAVGRCCVVLGVLLVDVDRAMVDAAVVLGDVAVVGSELDPARPPHAARASTVNERAIRPTVAREIRPGKRVTPP
jgi:hypothetical protein